MRWLSCWTRPVQRSCGSSQVFFLRSEENGELTAAPARLEVTAAAMVILGYRGFSALIATDEATAGK